MTEARAYRRPRYHLRTKRDIPSEQASGYSDLLNPRSPGLAIIPVGVGERCVVRCTFYAQALGDDTPFDNYANVYFGELLFGVLVDESGGSTTPELTDTDGGDGTTITLGLLRLGQPPAGENTGVNVRVTAIAGGFKIGGQDDADVDLRETEVNVWVEVFFMSGLGIKRPVL